MFTGFTILERSKCFMFEQFYNVIRPKLANATVNVLLSDTDSFCLEIKSKPRDNLDVFAQLADICDFSNYSQSSPRFSMLHASELGFWKDEMQGKKHLREFIGLRSKCYAFLLEEVGGIKTVHSKAKGVTKAYKKTLDFQQFKQCIEKLTRTELQQYHIRSKNHVLRTLALKRQAFSSFCDKRFLLCSIHSVGYGSKYIKEFERTKKCMFC
jgi:hypothetical protein